MTPVVGDQKNSFWEGTFKGPGKGKVSKTKSFL
jgi:hypothetical protein